VEGVSGGFSRENRARRCGGEVRWIFGRDGMSIPAIFVRRAGVLPIRRSARDARGAGRDPM